MALRHSHRPALGRQFRRWSPAPPTNLYEILFLGVLVLVLVLWLMERWRGPLGNGRRFKLFLSGYLLFRLLVEFIKPTVALPGLVCYVWGWVRKPSAVNGLAMSR